MSQSKVHVGHSLTWFPLSNQPTLIISAKLKQQVDFLHAAAGRTEWSGELITSEQGTINDLNKWKITAHDIWLADIGSPGFTGYEVDQGSFKAPDIVEMYERFPGLMDGTLKNHHVHTHHGMGAFFSGTDDSQLEDRGSQSNYFLMLIVDFKGTWMAKVAFLADKKAAQPAEFHFANNMDEIPPICLKADDKDEQVLVVMDCKLEYERVTEVELPDALQQEIARLSQSNILNVANFEKVWKDIAQSVEKPTNLVDADFKARFDYVKGIVAEEAEKKRLAYQATAFNRAYGKGQNASVGRGGSYLQQNFLRSDKDEWGKNTERDVAGNERDDFDRYRKGGSSQGSSVDQGPRKRGRTKKGAHQLSEEEFRQSEHAGGRNYSGTNSYVSEPLNGWDLRHATCLINALLDREPGLNYTPVTNRMYNKNYDLSEGDKKLWVAAFIGSVPDYMDMLWPESNGLIDQGSILVKVAELVQPYQHWQLCRFLYAAVQEECSCLWTTIEADPILSQKTKNGPKKGGKRRLSEVPDPSMDQDELDALNDARLESSIIDSYGNGKTQEIDFGPDGGLGFDNSRLSDDNFVDNGERVEDLSGGKLRSLMNGTSVSRSDLVDPDNAKSAFDEPIDNSEEGDDRSYLRY